MTNLACRLAFALLALVIARPAVAAPVGMAVSPAGELTLTLAGRPVATGAWLLRPDSYLPAEGVAPITPGPVTSVTATQASPSRADVHERHAAVTVDYALSLAGEDLTIAAHVVNRDPAHAQRPLAFAGLTFHFNPAARLTAQMAAWHWTYLVHAGEGVFHPSTSSPLGCWWVSDDAFGFSAFSESEFDRPALIAARWAAGDTVGPECYPEFYTARSLPPGASADLTVTFRVTTDRSTAHLIGGYKAVYDRRFPLPMFTPDRRPVASFTTADKEHVSRTNPRGYHSDNARFDTALGTAAYVRNQVPLLAARGFLGTIFWCPGGYKPPMYPPDFDVFPPSVQANVPALVSAYRGAGLRAGLCARPGDGVNRPKGADPTVYRLSADDPGQMRVMLDRFRHVIDMGFDLFYLDSIGGQGVNDVRILRQIRETVGPDVLLYSENSTDMSLPYAGRYCEWLPDGAGPDGKPTDAGHILWDGGVTLDGLRLIQPRATWLCVSRAADPIPHQFAEQNLVPIVADAQVGRLDPAKLRAVSPR